MKQVVIDNPILNSPFDEPKSHFRLEPDGITNEILEGRRRSMYFIPVPEPRKKIQQPTLFEEIRENDFINQIRARVSIWRQRGYPDITPITRGLLDHWRRADRERRLFFCQLEALETAIYLAEAAGKNDDNWIENRLREDASRAGTPLFRVAFKMATGSGKTVVMAMLIAWQVLNKRANPQDRRFADSFLIVSPGITIKDRLRVVLPSDPANFYKQLEIVPAEQVADLGSAKIVISNFHAFKQKETGDAGRLTKAILAAGKPNPFVETPDQMVRRVCRELGTKREIIVINDESHHCYRSKPDDEKLTGDDRREAEDREKAARLWITGLEAIHKKLGIKIAFDLSATPFYLRGSGYPEGDLFPWVVSDFSLVDAIESGIVKIPRVPVADDSMHGDQPTYRDLWFRIRDDLPKKGRDREATATAPTLPGYLEAALESLYGHYRKEYERWRNEAGDESRTPPVFIVVCNNTSVSKLVFDWIAGHESGKQHPDGAPYVAPGKLTLFSNVDRNRWILRPNTILVDSEQLESDEGMSAEFKKLAAAQIDEFKAELRARFPGRDAEQLTDQDLMREVLNTVGKAGKLGESIKCVVSVSMLTEGWDANTVTHILGVRAFGTQLLCEQVVGRGLRRRSYEVNKEGRFDPEYAEIFGVPFKFIPCSGMKGPQPPPVPTTRVRFVPERVEQHPALDIVFPRVTGYRYELGAQRLQARFDADSRFTLSTRDIPTRVENAPLIGKVAILTLDDLRARRPQEIAFNLARLMMERFFASDPILADAEAADTGQIALFPQLLVICRRWLESSVDLKDGAFKQMLLLSQFANRAAEKIYRAIVEATPGEKRLRPSLVPMDPLGDAHGVSFDTRRDTWQTKAEKSPISHVALDSDWEAKFAQTLEESDAVRAYVKNDKVGFKIPYVYEGLPRNYYPDYLVRVEDGGADLLNLIVEVSGQREDDKQAKVDTARKLWVPAVNGEGRFGRWAFLEVTDPWKVEDDLRRYYTK